MSNVKLNLEYSGITEKEIMKFKTKVQRIHEDLHKIANDESKFAGWIELPSNYNKDEFEKIKKASEEIRKKSDIFLVIGIGGSYLGARAVIESLTSTFYNLLPSKQRKSPQIFYIGNNISPNYMEELIECIGNKDVSINVISKSGTTTEPAIAFRIFREFLEAKYGIEEAKKRIYVTTDKIKGALKTLSDEQEYETFVIPNNIGRKIFCFNCSWDIANSSCRNKYR